MDAGSHAHAELVQGLGDDASAFLDRKRLVGLVLEPQHPASLIVIAHPALEAA